MKVIKEGFIKRYQRVICGNCNAELEIWASDLQEFGEETDVIRTKQEFSYICPCCRKFNYLTYKDLSDEIYLDLCQHLDYTY